MSSNSIERMIALNKKVEGGGIEQPRKSSAGNGMTARSQHDLDAIIENFDRQVYGPSPVMEEDNSKPKPYSAEKEMEYLKEVKKNGGRGSVDVSKRNMPKEILESILNNPLDDIPLDLDKMDELENRLKGNMPGIKAAVDVFERVEKRDKEEREKLNEDIRPRQTVESVSIDYDMIRSIVESVIDERMTSLNESKGDSNTYVPSMKIMNFKDKFLFVDNDDNVFECEMKYKGKRKKKTS